MRISGIRNLLAITLGGIFGLGACTTSVENGGVEPREGLPNIVLIVADDHGTNDLGCYGNPAVKTPNLDKLAGEGVRFTRAHCTSASCSASRSVILTGLYNHANGHFGHMHHFHHFSAFDHVYSLPVLLEEIGGVPHRPDREIPCGTGRSIPVPGGDGGQPEESGSHG